jgi:hypothetical protein
VLDRAFFSAIDVAVTKTSGKEVIMFKVLLKLATGIVVLGASVFTAVAATGATGDAVAEVFGSGDEKGPDGAVIRKAS